MSTSDSRSDKLSVSFEIFKIGLFRKRLLKGHKKHFKFVHLTFAKIKCLPKLGVIQHNNLFVNGIKHFKFAHLIFAKIKCSQKLGVIQHNNFTLLKCCKYS